MTVQRITKSLIVSVVLLLTSGCFLCFAPVLYGGDVKAKVHVIIDKLPIEKQEKMRDFDKVIKAYVESAPWLEEKDQGEPIEVSLQLFLKDIPSNVEDRYKCEFLISGSDVQYFDRRVRFSYEPNQQLVFSEQAVGPLTGVLNFYVYMIIASEFDEFSEFGGDIYYKKAQNMAALGKFVRSEYILGWTERDELIKRVFSRHFQKFRKAKDHYFYGMDVRDEKPEEARKNVAAAIDLIASVMEEKSQFEEPQQFLDAHYQEIIELFKDADGHSDLFKKLIKLDQEHKEQYEEYISDS